MVNRAEQLWKNWEESQRQLQQIPEIDMGSPKMLRLKYDFLTKGLYRITPDASGNEKLYLHVIRTVTDKLEKKLYPNLFMRMFHRLSKALVYKPLHMRRFADHRLKNMEQLKGELKRVGLNPFSDRLENHLDYETPKVNISSINRLSDGSTLALDVVFEKDKMDSYQFDHYKATITGKDGNQITSTFPSRTEFDIQEAINLLQGRAVRKAFEGMDGTVLRKWVQLDLENKIGGEAQMVTYADTTGFDLKGLLDKYATDLEHFSLLKERNIAALEEGHSVSFKLPELGEYHMQADPAENKVAIYDPGGNYISHQSLKILVDEAKNEHRYDFSLFPQQKEAIEHTLQISR